jgi:hypothetical protein
MVYLKCRQQFNILFVYQQGNLLYSFKTNCLEEIFCVLTLISCNVRKGLEFFNAI